MARRLLVPALLRKRRISELDGLETASFYVENEAVDELDVSEASSVS